MTDFHRSCRQSPHLHAPIFRQIQSNLAARSLRVRLSRLQGIDPERRGCGRRGQGTRLGRPKVDGALERKAQRQLEKGVGILKVAKTGDRNGSTDQTGNEDHVVPAFRGGVPQRQRHDAALDRLQPVNRPTNGHTKARAQLNLDWSDSASIWRFAAISSKPLFLLRAKLPQSRLAACRTGFVICSCKEKSAANHDCRGDDDGLRCGIAAIFFAGVAFSWPPANVASGLNRPPAQTSA
jgi:hypothetical protein